jgi:hypothetical protein
MMNILKPQFTPVVEIDWQAYFEGFCQVHGQPVAEPGDSPTSEMARLIFPDGWTYGLDYSGPETPPPANPLTLRALLIRYWELQKRHVLRELPERSRQADYLEDLARTHSSTLMTRTLAVDDKGGRRWERGPLDIGPIRGRLAWLESELKKCDLKLKELRDGTTENTADAGVAPARTQR